MIFVPEFLENQEVPDIKVGDMFLARVPSLGAVVKLMKIGGDEYQIVHERHGDRRLGAHLANLKVVAYDRKTNTAILEAIKA